MEDLESTNTGYINGECHNSSARAKNLEGVSSEFLKKENLTKRCSVKLFPLDLDVKQILSMDDPGGSFKDHPKRDNESNNDGPVLKKQKNDDIIVLESEDKLVDKVAKPPASDVTVIKVKSGTPQKDGSNQSKEKIPSPSSDGKSKSLIQRTGSFDSSRKSEKEAKGSKSSSSSNSAASSSSCTLDKTDRTSLNCLEQKLLELQKATQKKSPGEMLSSKPKSSSPLGIKPSKDSHHRRKEDFITERKKLTHSPNKKMLKKSTSLPVVKDNKMGNLFCPTTDAKVTILPINKPSPKDLEHKAPTTSNSVTITKISSGDSLHVPSKDIKKVFSPKSKSSPDANKTKLALKTFAKGEKHRSGEKYKEHKHRDKEHRSRESSRESRDGKEHRDSQKHNSCSKCNEQFSTKEAKKLHTCNSILDAHYLIDERDRQKTSPTSSVSNSEGTGSLSRSSSRSSSPGIPGVGSKKSSNDTPPKLKLSVNKNDPSESGKVKSEEKLKKSSSFGLKRDSPKEKWVESNKPSFKSDSLGEHYSSKERDNAGIVIEPVKLNYKNNEELMKHQLAKSNGEEFNREHDFTFSGKRTYSPSMGEAMSADGKESPRENNSKDSPASQADSGVFSIASSASPSKLDSGARSPDSPSRGPCLDPGASQWNKSMPGQGMAPSTSSPNSLSSYPDSCLPQGLQIPGNLSITRVPNQMGLGYPATVNAHGMSGGNKTMNMMANAPWMTTGMNPGGPNMHPHYPHMTPAMIEEMNKKKGRGRPRKPMDGMPGRPRNPKSKEDLYDFDEDDSKAMQPLRPRRQNAQTANYKDPDSDEDGRQRLAQAPLIHATQGFRQIQENTVGLTQVDGFGQHPSLQENSLEENHQQGEGEKDEKSVSYTCSKIEETPTGGIKLKIKLKKSQSPVPTDPEPPSKKPKTNSFEGMEEVEKSDSSIMSTMNEMQRLASGMNRSSPSSDYQMSVTKSPHPNTNSSASGHMMRPGPGQMKPGIPGGMEQRNQSAPQNMNNQMMMPNGPNNPVSNSPRNPDEASGMGGGAFPKVNNPYAMHSNYQNQGSHINNSNKNIEMQQHQQQQMSLQHQQMQQNPQQPPQQQLQPQQQQQHLQHQRQQQQPHHNPQQQQQNFPQNNFNNYNMGYNNYMDPRQQQQHQQMYNRQQYEQQQHMQQQQSFRPGFRPGGPGGPGMNMRPGGPGQGFMPQQQQPHMNPGLRYPQHGGQGMDPMSRMTNMGPGMDPRSHHPGMTHGGMMRPGMMGPGGMRPGHPGHMSGYPGPGPAPGHGNSMSREPGPNMMNNSSSVMSPVMPPNISPGSIHPQHPSRSPHVQDRQLFQNNQFRMSSPQYQGQPHNNFNNSPSYPGTPNSQGYPPTPGGYPQPLTPGGHQKPPTPQSIGIPPSPQSSIQNPLTPGSYPNPTTPGSYPNPTTPGSYPNPTTPVPVNPLTPQPQLQESPVSQPHTVNNSHAPSAPPGQPQFSAPKGESVIQSNPIQNIFKDTAKMTNPMLSPPSSLSTSDLRKIRRPSKSVTPGTVSPNQKNLSPNQIKTEIKQDPEHFEVKKEVPSPMPPTPEFPVPAIKAEPVVPKVEKPASPKPPPPPPKTPEPPKEPRWGEDGPDGMPERALQKVFQYVCYSQGCLPFLLSAMKICKLWCKVAKEPALWTHANLGSKIKEKLRTEKNLEWILKNKFPNALEVDVSNWRAAISSPALKIIAAHCPNLRGLGLSQCVKLSHEDVRIIPSLFPNLQKIDVSCVAPTTASSRSAASSSCLSDLITAIGENMTHFNMSSNKMAGLPFVFKAISQHSKNLIELDVSNISTTSRDTVLINIEKIQKGCPKLRTLRTTNTMLGLNDASVRDQMTSPGFPFLEELTIGVDQRGYFDGMDDQQIERILKKSDKLKVLDIRGCKSITDSTLVRLPCWDIEYLYVSGCSVTSSSKDGLELLVKKWCRTLVDIDIGNTTDNKTVDWALIALVENEDVLRLRKLNLNNTGVSLKTLTKLLKACKTLESLNLTSCRALPRGMKRMYHNKEDVDSLTQDIIDGKFDPKDAGSDDDD